MSKKEIKTLKDLAAYTGFTIATVSRVLNGLGPKYRISSKTQDIIKKAAKEKKFSFNEYARGLRLKKTFTIGLIVPDISNPFFAKFASLIEKEARLKNYTILLCDSNNSTEIEKSSVELLQNRKVDGIIAFPVGIEYNHLIEIYKNTSLIIVDRYFKDIDIPYVASDEYDGAYKAVMHLIDLGHRKIACIRGLVGTSSDTERVRGYKNALYNSNIPINNEFIIGCDFGFKNGYEQAKKLIRNYKATGLTAIFSTGSQITLGIMKAFDEENISIYNDISLISFDEQNYSYLLSPPMTTIAQPKEEMGKLAFDMLLEQMESKNKVSQTSQLIDTTLIKRKSVKSLL